MDPVLLAAIWIISAPFCFGVLCYLHKCEFEVVRIGDAVFFAFMSMFGPVSIGITAIIYITTIKSEFLNKRLF